MITHQDTKSACLFAAALAAAGAGLPACTVAGHDAGPAAGDEGNLGTSVEAVTSVPPGVQCIQVVLTGSASSTIKTSVTMSPMTIPLGEIPAGSLTVTATAYNVACASVTASTPPSWIGTTTVTITPGLTTQIALTLTEDLPVNASVSFVPKVQAIGAGAWTSYAVLADGTVRSWGGNIYGELGIGSTSYSYLYTPSAVNNLADVASVAGGYGFACALQKTGAAACWGTNGSGQLGNGNTTSQTSPVPVSGSHVFNQVVVGSAHACGNMGNGIFCWGDNSCGQFLSGTTTGASTPQLGYFGSSTVAAAGYCATVSYNGNSGTGAGSNASYQFGETAINGNTNGNGASLGFDGSGQRFISTIGASPYDTFICAVTEVGTVYCAGDNGSGQLGNGTTTTPSAPVLVSGITNATSVALGAAHTCALLADGTVSCWGANFFGQLGNGTAAQATAPVQVLGLSNAIAVAAGEYHTCALKNDGTVWCWGYNGYGAVGDGTTFNRALPVQVQF